MQLRASLAYYQHFTGEIFFQHRPPIDPSSMSRWRKRIGEEGVEWLLTKTGERGHDGDGKEHRANASFAASPKKIKLVAYWRPRATRLFLAKTPLILPASRLITPFIKVPLMLRIVPNIKNWNRTEPRSGSTN